MRVSGLVSVSRRCRQLRVGALEPQREPLLLAGVVMSTRTQMTRRGKMAIVMLDDGTTQLEVSVFNELGSLVGVERLVQLVRITGAATASMISARELSVKG